MYIDTNSIEYFKKTKNKATLWPNNPTPGHIHYENHNSKSHTYPIVHYSNIYNSQDMEAT